ncbi:ChaN family lipoprotein [[Limnothrix rosea] IAM M-220]|uniref:ChaN family lipoprotein n=1 Tax=[Limnothrix rosea] IAM M-220 TaxID=454133 RepID=UPI000959008A|nr:ChaN family lipoprotein [[Limnothrix rosea] IAM M-220]OKH19193.1 iron-regulated protein [[Limnothrix rosea] IAM M-220]
MKIRPQIGFIALSGLLAIAPAGCALQGTDSQEIPDLPPMPEQSIEPLATADVVFLGELHDSERDHAAQLQIIQELYARNPDLVIGMEMFQRPYQAVLDSYIAGEITEAEFVEQSEYEKLWGFPWELYAPIMRFARENKIPVLALNAPGETVSRVARGGVEALTAEDMVHIPPVSELDLSNNNYRNFVQGAFGAHSAHGNFNFDNFFTAQVIWDETMAATIADFRILNPERQVVVLAGQGHVIYGYGIPDRVERRLGPDLETQIVLLNPVPEFTVYGSAIADMFWWSQKSEEALKKETN